VQRNRILVTMATLLSLLWTFSSAQDHCGTACPVCTGELKLDRTADSSSYNSHILRHGGLNWFTIYTPAGHGEEDEKGSTSLSLGLLNRIETGLTVGIESWEVRGKLKLLVLSEAKLRPALLAGLGNVKPTSVETNAYLMLAKTFNSGIPLPIWFYLGAGKPFDGRDVEPIWGLSVGVVNNGGLMSAYDGQEFHLGAAYQPLRYLSFGAMMVDMKHLGLFASLNGKVPFISSVGNPIK